MVTLAGLGANPAEEAVYPLLVTDADGDPVTGDRDYVLHFDPIQLPPGAAFWSLTMYDAEGFQVPNDLSRYALGDRDPLTYNLDGSLDLYLSIRNPGPEREPQLAPSSTWTFRGDAAPLRTARRGARRPVAPTSGPETLSGRRPPMCEFTHDLQRPAATLATAKRSEPRPPCKPQSMRASRTHDMTIFDDDGPMRERWSLAQRDQRPTRFDLTDRGIRAHCP